MPNVLVGKPLLIHLIQNRISYCISPTSLVITLTEKQINVLIIFQGKPYYCSRQLANIWVILKKSNVKSNVLPTYKSSPCPQGSVPPQPCGSVKENIPFLNSQGVRPAAALGSAMADWCPTTYEPNGCRRPLRWWQYLICPTQQAYTYVLALHMDRLHSCIMVQTWVYQASPEGTVLALAPYCDENPHRIHKVSSIGSERGVQPGRHLREAYRIKELDCCCIFLSTLAQDHMQFLFSNRS